MLKYKISNEAIIDNMKTLYRIEALRDFGDVKAGDRGGFIEKESNLSHDGNCWVFNCAEISGDARVLDNALVFNGAEIGGKTVLRGEARIHNTKMPDHRNSW